MRIAARETAFCHRLLASAAYSFQVQGRLARALKANLEAYDRFPEAQYVEVQIATTLGLLGFEDAAVVWFDHALALKPDNVFAAVALSQFRLSRGRLDEAERVANKAVAAGIRRPELHVVLGHVAMLRGAADEAARHYRNGVAVNWLLIDPLLQALRRDPGFLARIERIRKLVEAERRTVLAADWLPRDFVVPTSSAGHEAPTPPESGF